MADRIPWSRRLLGAAAVSLAVAAPLRAAEAPAAPVQQAAPAEPKQGNMLLAIGAGVLIGVAVLVVLATAASD